MPSHIADVKGLSPIIAIMVSTSLHMLSRAAHDGGIPSRDLPFPCQIDIRACALCSNNSTTNISMADMEYEETLLVQIPDTGMHCYLRS